MNIIKKTKMKCPLIHCITNYVTVNDVANVILACGASPIMADEINEVEEMQTNCNALVINIGTLNERTIHSMILAGNTANRLNHVVILDPVGAGATKFRTEIVFKLLNEIKFDVIKGNISEIKAIARIKGKTNGVDASSEDKINEGNINDVIELAKGLSNNTKAIIVITGAIDVISDGIKTYLIRNGHANMSMITGTGCMLAGIIAAYVSSNIDAKMEAVTNAVSAIGVCAETAIDELNDINKTASLKIGIIDQLAILTDETLKEKSNIESR